MIKDDTPDILVVDDERSVREGLASALAQAGYASRACDGIESARGELEKRRPACVLLDIRLKDGDGLQFLEEIRRSMPNIPVIIATAYGDSDRTIHAMKHGAFNYVTKPFDLDAPSLTVAPKSGDGHWPRNEAAGAGG